MADKTKKDAPSETETKTRTRTESSGNDRFLHEANKLRWMRDEGVIDEAEYLRKSGELIALMEKNRISSREIYEKYKLDKQKILEGSKKEREGLWGGLTKKYRNYQEGKKVDEEITQAKKDGIEKIKGYKEGVGNYAIAVTDFERILKTTDFYEVNANAFAEYLLHLKRQNRLNNMQYLENVMGKYQLLGLAEKWGLMGEGNKTHSIAKTVLGKEYKPIEQMLSVYLRTALAGRENIFNTLKTIKGCSVTKTELIQLLDEKAKGKTLSPQDLIRIIAASGIGKNIDEEELKRAFIAGKRDLDKDHSFSDFVRFKISKGMSNESTYRFVDVIRKLDPKSDLSKLSKSEVATLREKDLMDKNKKTFLKSREILKIIEKSGFNDDVKKYATLYSAALNVVGNYGITQDSAEMGEREHGAMKKVLNRGLPDAVPTSVSVVETDHLKKKNRRAIEYGQKEFLPIIRSIPGFEGIKDVHEICDDGEKVNAIINRLKKRKGSKDADALLKHFESLKANSVHQQINFLSCHTGISKNNLIVAVAKGQLVLGSFSDPPAKTLYLNPRFSTEGKGLSSQGDHDQDESGERRGRKGGLDSQQSLHRAPQRTPAIRSETIRTYEHAASGSVVNIPSGMNLSESRAFFGIFFKSLDSQGSHVKEIIIDPKTDLKVRIRAQGEGKYEINFGGAGGKTYSSLDRKDIRNALSFATYSNSLGMGFLLSRSHDIIQAIGITGKIREKDGLDVAEKSEMLQIMGKALIPGYRHDPSDIRMCESQFVNPNIPKEAKEKDPFLKGHVGGFPDMGSLAKKRFPKQNGDLDYDALIGSIRESARSLSSA